jgi:hypothetical protein
MEHYLKYQVGKNCTERKLEKISINRCCVDYQDKNASSKGYSIPIIVLTQQENILNNYVNDLNATIPGIILLRSDFDF